MKYLKHIDEAINIGLIESINRDVEDILTELLHDYRLASTVKTTYAPNLSGGYCIIDILILDSRSHRKMFIADNIYPTMDRIKDYLTQRGAKIKDFYFYYGDRLPSLRGLEGIVNVKIRFTINDMII